MTLTPTRARGQGGAADVPPPDLDWALFLDFDGTLAPLAARPDAVRVSPRVIDSLDSLARSLKGAVAVVSGRPVSELDAFLSPLHLAAAGMHGLEWRPPLGSLQRPADAHPGLERVKAALAASTAHDPRLLLEDKVHAIALHYRQAPEEEDNCRRLVEGLLTAEGDDLHVLDGKMVLEIKPAGSDKGRAIFRLMGEPDFLGRVPVFAGDDVTDEDGFAAVNAMGGISIKVGEAGDTRARHRMPDVDSFVDWLQDVKRRLEEMADFDGGGAT